MWAFHGLKMACHHASFFSWGSLIPLKVHFRVFDGHCKQYRIDISKRYVKKTYQNDISNRYKVIKTIYRNDIPQCGQIDFCVHKSTTCYYPRIGKSKKCLHALKTSIFPYFPPSPKGDFFVLFFPLKFNPQGMEGIAKRTPDPLKIKKDIYLYIKT